MVLRWPWDEALVFLAESQAMEAEEEDARAERFAAAFGNAS